MANEELSLATNTDATSGIGTTPGGTQDGIGTSPGTKPGIGTTPVNDGQARAEANHRAKAAAAFTCEINGQLVPLVSFAHSVDDPKGDEGGDRTAEKAEASSGSSQHNESTMGHNYVTELTLVTFVTPDDNTFSDAAHAIANKGQNLRYTITITEMAKDKSVIKTFVYENALLTSVKFPAVDSAGGEMLTRTSRWKPEILTVS